MDLHAFAGALAGVAPPAALALGLVYPPGNRIWGGDPRRVLGKGPFSGRRIVIALLLVAGVPLGWISAGGGGALVPALFLAWRAIIIGEDWTTPDTPKEVAQAFAHHAIPAAIVALAVFACSQAAWPCPWEWPLAALLAAHAMLATTVAVRFARLEAGRAEDLRAGRITPPACDAAIRAANRRTETWQGASFWAAVLAWTLTR